MRPVKFWKGQNDDQKSIKKRITLETCHWFWKAQSQTVSRSSFAVAGEPLLCHSQRPSVPWQGMRISTDPKSRE